MRVFFSYSHRDAGILERLRVHLATLRRDQRIEVRYDYEILVDIELAPDRRHDEIDLYQFESATIC